ncbi:hypothetical protein B0H13DRAFT_2382217 [Mycena leptocephala]|nr:hypothetical protein B0H13DRAFT_2382217 [Mycena leptocephala]
MSPGRALGRATGVVVDVEGKRRSIDPEADQHSHHFSLIATSSTPEHFVTNRPTPPSPYPNVSRLGLPSHPLSTIHAAGVNALRNTDRRPLPCVRPSQQTSHPPRRQSYPASSSHMLQVVIRRLAPSAASSASHGTSANPRIYLHLPQRHRLLGLGKDVARNQARGGSKSRDLDLSSTSTSNDGADALDGVERAPDAGPRPSTRPLTH